MLQWTLDAAHGPLFAVVVFGTCIPGVLESGDQDLIYLLEMSSRLKCGAGIKVASAYEQQLVGGILVQGHFVV